MKQPHDGTNQFGILKWKDVDVGSNALLHKTDSMINITAGANEQPPVFSQKKNYTHRANVFFGDALAQEFKQTQKGYIDGLNLKATATVKMHKI